jgi:LacI family transcriptional regulator, galactose operon repressor
VKPTIKDMAKTLGVSHTTVSRALRDSPEIGAEMTRKVKELAQSLAYRPNALARNLVERKSNYVGIIIPDIENPFYAALSKSIIRFFENNDYRVLICNSDRDVDKERSYIQHLQEQQVDGTIMIPADVTQDYFMDLTQSGLPLVLIDHDGTHQNIDSVMSDNYMGAFEAVTHLINSGFQRIAHIAGPDNADPSIERMKGYIDALQGGMGKHYTPWIAHSDSTFIGGLQASSELFANLNNLPDAVFAVNDITALSIIQYIYEKGLHIPGDVAIVGFDDISMARMASVPLTTVRQSPTDLAREAGDILLDKMRTGYMGPTRNLLLKPQLIVRESCGAHLQKSL